MEIIMEIFLVSVVLHVLLHELGDVLKLQATGLLYVLDRITDKLNPTFDFFIGLFS